DVRTLIMEKAHAMKYYVRLGVKDEHQRSSGLLLQPEIPDWKWEKERLTMDKFSVGDHVMMKVSPWKGVVRFGKKGELTPRLFARLIEEFGFALHRAWLIVVRHESEKMAWPIMNSTCLGLRKKYRLNLKNDMPPRDRMDNPKITMEQYIKLEEEKARKHGKVCN
nr:putative reverse transcriptase domain-containing protein [Tanacetum cinerariifolium]